MIPEAERPGAGLSSTADDPTVLYDVDEFFHATYDAGIRRTQTPDRGTKRRMRFYGLVQALESTSMLSGWVIECGCWKGLSSYLICEYLRKRTPNFAGEQTTLVDSFEGLSEPTAEDVIERDMVVKGRARKGRPFKLPGAYAATEEHLRQVLEQYPAVELVRGWIPQVLDSLPSRPYRFVHIDLDLYQPILGALQYFYPRVVRGGVIVCDDYGSLFFPGAKKAVETFCNDLGVGVLSSAFGGAIIVKA